MPPGLFAGVALAASLLAAWLAWLAAGNAPAMTRRWTTLADAVAIGVPFVVDVSEHTGGWGCRNWTPASLARDLPAVQAKFQPGPVFWHFDADSEMQMLADSFNSNRIPRAPPHREEIVGAREFFEALEPPAASYAYASGPIEDVVPPRVRRRDLPAPAAGGAGSLVAMSPGNDTEINVWFTMPNTSAAAHFDTSHNLHLVLHGTKTFTFLPPSAANARRLYPALHPYCRQLQDPSGAILAGGVAGEPDPVHVTAAAGQAVFIPAYWLHAVATVRCVCVSHSSARTAQRGRWCTGPANSGTAVR